MTDAAVKGDQKEGMINPTPLCLLFGQGHQHFLDRSQKCQGNGYRRRVADRVPQVAPRRPGSATRCSIPGIAVMLLFRFGGIRRTTCATP
jgi:hypothetical protein